MQKILLSVCCILVWNLGIAKSDIFRDTASDLQFRLSAFFGKCLENNKIEISFSVAETFSSVSHFAIFRSLNNIDFENVGEVQQTDNAPVTHHYSFIDKLPLQNLPEIIYYKLKQVCINNTTTESHIITVKVKKSKTNFLKTWPNPVRENLQIQFKTNLTDNLNLQIVNNIGEILQQGIVSIKKGQDIVQWPNAAQLKTGVYFIILKQTNKIIGQSLFIKN